LVRTWTKNVSTNGQVRPSPIDLAGNFYDGQDADQNGSPDKVDHRVSFAVGVGQAIVNIPVLPEVVYFATSLGGVGAIDLNGYGFTTNKPGANSTDYKQAQIVTQLWRDTQGCEAWPGGAAFSDEKAIIAYDGNRSTNGTTDPCTLAPYKEWPHNRFYYPVGIGSFPYGPTINAERAKNGEYPNEWHAANDPGNPGTPFPGVNEGSSGFETLCRDSTGDAVLTGRTFGQVGVVNDMIVGDFLDRVYYDHFNPKTNNAFHVGFFAGGASTQGRNLISEPPVPNPPPTHYWVGLPQVDVALNPANAADPGVMIEGEEVWVGFRANGPNAISGVFGAGKNGPTTLAKGTTGWIHLKVNPLANPISDSQIPPYFIG
ncbi:MAG TPA: hypothetical protein PLV92_28405, partial [Pirellulaceae bacterium]|nr:hypothetical protein [Pirellulaceae bacterium]